MPMFSLTLANETHPGCKHLIFGELGFAGQGGDELGHIIFVNEK